MSEVEGRGIAVEIARSSLSTPLLPPHMLPVPAKSSEILINFVALFGVYLASLDRDLIIRYSSPFFGKDPPKRWHSRGAVKGATACCLPVGTPPSTQAGDGYQLRRSGPTKLNAPPAPRRECRCFRLKS